MLKLIHEYWLEITFGIWSVVWVFIILIPVFTPTPTGGKYLKEEELEEEE